MAQVEISQEQAQRFARAILPYIHAYVQAHQDEFQKFLKKEKQEDEGGDNE